MTPRLYGHPFSSYTWKALIAFDEAQAPVEFVTLEPGANDKAAALATLHPLGRFPVLETEDGTFWESSVIGEWAHLRARTVTGLIPNDPVRALRTRERDRIFDGYVMTPMQTVVADALRPEPHRDAVGVQRAKETLARIYDWLDGELAGTEHAAGDAFTLADCSAAPSLFYADWVLPVAGHDHLAAYLRRLRDRPSVRRVVEGARPFRAYFPLGIPAHAD